MSTGIELIAKERNEQIEKHGFTGEHHINHPEWYNNMQLQFAAATLLMHEFEEQIDVPMLIPQGWKDMERWQRLNWKNRKERLIISAALIAAELDRLQAMEPQPEGKGKEVPGE